MPRLFIAAWPPARVLDALSELPRPDADGVRWTTRDQWHVTLRFLGSVDEDEAAEALATVAAEPAQASIGPQVGQLGRTVIVAPVQGLDGLADAVRAATAEVGDPVDPRPFRGHITLARVKDGGTCALAGTPIAGGFSVDEVALVRSELHAEGARYATVTTHRLSS